MEWEHSVELPCSFPHTPRHNCPAVRCIIEQVENLGRSPQRSSDRFWIASATAVRRREMTERGSSLPITALPDTIMLAPAWRREEIRKILSPKSRLSYLPDVCLSRSPLHTCEWCQDQHLHQLQCLKTETDSSTSWPGLHQKQGKLFQQTFWMLREGEAGREHLSGLGTIRQMRGREMLRLIFIY